MGRGFSSFLGCQWGFGLGEMGREKGRLRMGGFSVKSLRFRLFLGRILSLRVFCSVIF